MNDDDAFQYWLFDMEGAIESFLEDLPGDIRSKLDFTADSLFVVGSMLSNRYEYIAEIADASEAEFFDGVTRYVGQTIRRELGGRWAIETGDPMNAFYKLPQLIGCKNQTVQVCPQKLATATLGRKDPELMYKLLVSHK